MTLIAKIHFANNETLMRAAAVHFIRPARDVLRPPECGGTYDSVQEG